jgi:hypothetical protein
VHDLCRVTSRARSHAGTNNARVATLLRQLASYYHNEADHLFTGARVLVVCAISHVCCTQCVSLKVSRIWARAS